MFSRTENISVISYEDTKKHNDKWSEPPATEFIIQVIVTAKARNICKMYTAKKS